MTQRPAGLFPAIKRPAGAARALALTSLHLG
jgi:hypothetical protein